MSIRALVITVLIISVAIVMISATQFLSSWLYTVSDSWKVVNTSIGVLYLADSPQLMAEGYRYKDSYDFAGKGAVGMLFPIYVLKPTHVCFTMEDVKLPLVLIIAQRIDAKSNKFIVHYKAFMQLSSSDFCLSDMHFTFTYDVIAIELNPDIARAVKRGDIITVYSALP